MTVPTTLPTKTRTGLPTLGHESPVKLQCQGPDSSSGIWSLIALRCTTCFLLCDVFLWTCTAGTCRHYTCWYQLENM